MRFENVSKRYTLTRDAYEDARAHGDDRVEPNGDFWALRGVDFALKEGQCVALIGANGSGKSTLLRLLCGITAPDGGKILRSGSVSAVLELGAGFHPELTGRENVMLAGSLHGLSKAALRAALPDILELAGIGAYAGQPLKRYSTGMAMRLGLAVALRLPGSLLVIDEALGVGDAVFQRRAIAEINALRREGKTIILVSHAVGLLRELCDWAILLEQGRITENGPFEQVMGPASAKQVATSSTEFTRTAPFHPSKPCLRTARIIADETAEVWRFELTFFSPRALPMPAALTLCVCAGNGANLGTGTVGTSGRPTDRLVLAPGITSVTLEVSTTCLARGHYFFGFGLTPPAEAREYDYTTAILFADLDRLVPPGIGASFDQNWGIGSVGFPVTWSTT